MTSTGTVVVGADGSPAAATAIEYGLRDAARRGAPLRIVAAAQLPQYWAGGYSMPALPAPEEIIDDLRGAVREQLDEVLKAHPQLAAVPVTVEAVIGAPGRVLVEAAAGADELVLGHRGRGAVGSALLGSVGLQCVLHATCPVTIVRPAVVAELVPDTAGDTASATVNGAVIAAQA
jgi:nucleotide-binding universal stress UspA family protein